MLTLHDITHPLWHPVFEIAGFVAAGVTYRRVRSRRGDHLGEQPRFGIIVAAVIGAAIGSKVLHHLAGPGAMAEAFASGGLTSLGLHLMGGKTIVGGMLGGWLAVEWVKARSGIRTRTGDLFVAPLVVGTMVGRLGCLMAGPRDNTLGVVTESALGMDFGDGLMRYPTPLFELLFLGLFGLWLRRRYGAPGNAVGPSPARPEGEAFRVFLAGYLAFRLLIDSVKPYEQLLGLGGIQWACLLGLLGLGVAHLRDRALASSIESETPGNPSP